LLLFFKKEDFFCLAQGAAKRHRPPRMTAPLKHASGLSLPHRLWRYLPAGPRRRALSRVTAALAPRPDPAPPPVAQGVAVCGESHRASGLGQGARLMAAALRDLGIPVWDLPVAALPGETMAASGVLPPPGVPLVLHINAPALPAALLRLPKALLRGRRVIGYWAWELPVAPPGWAAGVGFVHDIWVPSQFTAQALEALAPGRVRVVPHPVAVAPPRPASLDRAAFGLPAEAFVVLTAFSLASSFARKNPRAAIAAFRAAFGDRQDRILVLKLSHTESWPADLAVLREATAGAPNIRIDTRILPEAEYHALTACADAVLSLHRSEGFGLVPAEAMLLGKPVLATDWSATAEFIDAQNGVPVPYTLIPAVDPRGVFEAPGAVWAEADVAAAAQALRGLADDPARCRALGQAAQADARRLFTAAPLRAALRAIGLDAAG
jgi:glycosyltransferase involved in cell wall biosynthesis